MTYTYKCTNETCEHIFDIEKSVNDVVEPVCGKCGSGAKRIFKPLGNVWKAGGNFGVGK
jgi:predicted nucleic acid-binding Zn ribbon protein